MRIIRASEVGEYLFCRRAWWYHAQGVVSENRRELAGGSAYHRKHGRQVLRSGLLRALAWVFLITALIVLAAGLALLTAL